MDLYISPSRHQFLLSICCYCIMCIQTWNCYLFSYLKSPSSSLIMLFALKFFLIYRKHRYALAFGRSSHDVPFPVSIKTEKVLDLSLVKCIELIDPSLLRHHLLGSVSESLFCPHFRPIESESSRGPCVSLSQGKARVNGETSRCRDESILFIEQKSIGSSPGCRCFAKT